MIRPPGAVPESEFLARCIACGACMKACPTRALQPCTIEDGAQRLFTPRLVPRVGACDDKCHLCGHVCPTGAIRALPLEEKKYVKVGTAVIDRHRCLSWQQNKECLVCDEVCPYNAIEARVVDTVKDRYKVPVVFEDYCTGCGLCEYHCPIADSAAIQVYRFGEKRLSRGEYLSARQKQMIQDRRTHSDAAHLSVEAPSAGFTSDAAAQSPAAPDAQAAPQSNLPSGFTP